MDGVIILNKPKGMTSFSVVNAIHKLLKTKAGHTGTLDPMATGVLVVMLGKATKKAKELESSDKEYEAEMTFGVETDTLDATGKTTSEHEVDITEQQLKDAMKTFEGDIEQVPPMVSAIKKNGVRLYQLARKGIEVEREPRKIKISRLELKGFSGKKADILVECSKGTYIRSLCADIGSKLGCGAHMSALIRTRNGNYSLRDSHTLEEVIKLHNLGQLEAKICRI